MKIQYATFLLPLHAGSTEQEELNRFLRGHRIIQTHKELAAIGSTANWALLIEYLEGSEKSSGEPIKNRVDYKEILNQKDFLLFSKLREARKKLAEDNGLPVYAVCTNDQLAEIAKSRPKNLTEFMKIEGIGKSKADKYFSFLLTCINSESHEEQPTML